MHVKVILFNVWKLQRLVFIVNEDSYIYQKKFLQLYFRFLLKLGSYVFDHAHVKVHRIDPINKFLILRTHEKEEKNVENLTLQFRLTGCK